MDFVIIRFYLFAWIESEVTFAMGQKTTPWTTSQTFLWRISWSLSSSSQNRSSLLSLALVYYISFDIRLSGLYNDISIPRKLYDKFLPADIWDNPASIFKIRHHHFVIGGWELVFHLFTCKFSDILLSDSLSFFPLLFKRKLSDFSVIDCRCNTRVPRIQIW